MKANCIKCKHYWSDLALTCKECSYNNLFQPNKPEPKPEIPAETKKKEEVVANA